MDRGRPRPPRSRSTRWFRRQEGSFVQTSLPGVRKGRRTHRPAPIPGALSGPPGSPAGRGCSTSEPDFSLWGERGNATFSRIRPPGRHATPAAPPAVFAPSHRRGRENRNATIAPDWAEAGYPPRSSGRPSSRNCLREAFLDTPSAFVLKKLDLQITPRLGGNNGRWFPAPLPCGRDPS